VSGLSCFWLPRKRPHAVDDNGTEQGTTEGKQQNNELCRRTKSNEIKPNRLTPKNTTNMTLPSPSSLPSKPSPSPSSLRRHHCHRAASHCHSRHQHHGCHGQCRPNHHHLWTLVMGVFHGEPAIYWHQTMIVTICHKGGDCRCTIHPPKHTPTLSHQSTTQPSTP